MTWLSPDSKWPRHSDGGVRSALSEARDRGWWFRKLTSHRFGMIICTEPTGERLTDACSFNIDSSARTGDTDQRILDTLRDCPHGGDAGGEPEPTDVADADDQPDAADAEQRVALADRYLTTAEGLLDAMERLAQRDSVLARRDELLEMAAEAFDDAQDQLLAEAEFNEQEARTHAATAHDAADAHGFGHEPWPPPDPEAALSVPAADYAGAAEQVLDGVDPEAAAECRDRLEALGSRLERYRLS